MLWRLDIEWDLECRQWASNLMHLNINSITAIWVDVVTCSRKPLLSTCNFKKRLAFDKEHVKWLKKNGGKVFFSTNQSSIFLAEKEGCVFFVYFCVVYVYRMVNERLLQYMKPGGWNIIFKLGYVQNEWNVLKFHPRPPCCTRREGEIPWERIL